MILNVERDGEAVDGELILVNGVNDLVGRW